MSAIAGRHRWRGLVLPEAPTDAERSSYEWRAMAYLTAGLFISSLFIVLAQALMEIRNARILPIAAAAFGTYTLIYLIYQLVSLCRSSRAGVGLEPRTLPGCGHLPAHLR
jgi:hypothetical protein